MGRLRRLWHSRDWLLVPLGGMVLLAATIFAVSEAGWLEREYRPPRFGLHLVDLSYAHPASEPTTGMRFAASVYATVTDAPPVRSRMVDPRVGQGSTSGLVHEDIARFIRAWPQASLIDQGSPAETTHLALRPEDFASGGRLVLRSGCLRIIKEGWDEERLAVPFGLIDLFRDPENYLSVGAYNGPEETRLRIGEPGGMIHVTPVHDAQLEGVDKLRALCGEAPIVLLHLAKRLPDCSDEYLAAEQERQRRSRTAQQALDRDVRERSAACRARRQADIDRSGGSTLACPPDVVPAPAPPVPPPPPNSGGSDVCRYPDEPIDAAPSAAS